MDCSEQAEELDLKHIPVGYVLIPEPINLTVGGSLFKILSGIVVCLPWNQLTFPSLSFTLLDYKLLEGKNYVSLFFVPFFSLLMCLVNSQGGERLMRYLLSDFIAPVTVSCII